MHLLVEFIFGFLSTWGFGIVTNVPKRTLTFSGLVGASAWTVYIIVSQFNSSVIVTNLMAAIVIGLFANIEAIVIKTPVNIIFVPAVISLVPGALFYQSMELLTIGANHNAINDFLKTGLIDISLVIGFIIGEIIFFLVKPLINKIFHRNRINY